MGDMQTIQTIVKIAGVAGLGVFVVIGMLRTLIVKWLSSQSAKLTKKQIEGIVRQIIWSGLTIAVLSLLVWGTTQIVESINQTSQAVANTSGQVEALRTELERTQQERETMSHELTNIRNKLEQITEPSLKEQIPGYEIIERRVAFDLTGWTPVPPDRRTSHKDCEVITRSTQRVVRVKKEARSFISTYATSGTWDPAFACTTHRLECRINNDDLPEGKPNLRRWVLEFDISDEPIYEEFSIQHSVTSWNSFQNLTEEFAETLITHPCKSAVLEVALPHSMTYVDGSAQGGKYPLGPPLTYMSDEEAALDYDAANHLLRMTVHEPRLGMHYRLAWRWTMTKN